MEYNALLTLGKIVANANPSAPTSYAYGADNFTYEELNGTFAKELNDLHKKDSKAAYALMEQVISDVLPKKVMQQYGQFAEIQQFPQGSKPVFVQRITEQSKRRAKTFVTKVGLAGHYEVFKLDGKSYEVTTSAYGGAANIGYEEFLDGRITMADVLNLVLEALDEVVYSEIEKALIASVSNLQAANKTVQAGFQRAAFNQLLLVADSYGNGNSTIYCTLDFAAKMIPTDATFMSDSMKENLWNNGYFGTYMGHRVVVLNQSFVDEKNKTVAIDPGYVWIVPGTAEKPVKVAFEGTTHMRETQNEDWSTSVHIYQKLGFVATITNDICVYRDSSLNSKVLPDLAQA